MFSANRGDTILPVTSDANFGPVYWVASSKSNSTYYVKLANYGSSTQDITVQFADVSLSTSATLTLLSGGEFVANYPGIVSIEPVNSTITASESAGYSFSIPAWGVAVVAAVAGDSEPGASTVAGSRSESAGSSLRVPAWGLALVAASVFV